MPGTAGITHDITIADSDGSTNKRGFMLWRGREGRRKYTVRDAQTIAPRILTESELSQAQLPPELQLIWYQDDWSLGIGGQYDRIDRKQSAETIGLDTSLARVARPARARQTITLSATPTDTKPSGFAFVESDVTGNPVLWAFVGRESWSLDAGGLTFTLGNAPQARNVVYRNGLQYGRYTFAPCWDTLRDSTINVAENLSATDTVMDVSANPTTLIAPDDIVLVDDEKMRVTAISASPASITVTRGFAGTTGATHANLLDIYIVDTNGDPYFYIYKSAEEANWTAAVNPGRFKYFAKTRNAAGDEVLWGGHHMYDSTEDLAAAATSSATTLTVTATPSANLVEGDIIRIEEEKMLVITVTDAGPTIEVIRGYAGTVAVAHATALDIEIYGPHLLRSSTDPRASTWSSTVAIGRADHPITALVADGDSLLVCKTNGVWAYYTDGSTENLTPEFENQRHEENFLGAYNWNGHILLPIGGGGLLDLHEGAITDISFQKTMPNNTGLHNQILGFVGDATTLFASLLRKDDSNTLDLLMAQEVEYGGETKLRWHNLSTTTTGRNLWDRLLLSMLMDTSRLDHKRMWRTWGQKSAPQTTTPDTLDFFPFGNLGTDRADRIATNDFTLLVTLKWDGNLPQVSKSLATVEVETANLLAGTRHITVWYRLDNATSWTQLLTNITTSPFQTVRFPAGLTAKVLQLRFNLVQFTGTPVSDTTVTKLLSFRVTAQLRPSAIALLPLSVYLADEQMILNGAMQSTVKGDLAQLNTWDQGAAEVRVIVPGESIQSLVTRTRQMVFLPGQMTVEEIAHDYGRRPEYVAKLLLAAV